MFHPRTPTQSNKQPFGTFKIRYWTRNQPENNVIIICHKRMFRKIRFKALSYTHFLEWIWVHGWEFSSAHYISVNKKISRRYRMNFQKIPSDGFSNFVKKSYLRITYITSNMTKNHVFCCFIQIPIVMEQWSPDSDSANWKINKVFGFTYTVR